MEHPNPSSGKLNIELRDAQRTLGRFKARRLGTDGIFVETGPVDLITGDLLDVTLMLKGGRIKKLKGLVVHQSEDGMGLVFPEHDPSMFNDTDPE